jgi:hypothetical protein
MNPEEVYSLIAAGNRRCQVAPTAMNERSNRAHRIFIITVAFSRYGFGRVCALSAIAIIVRADMMSMRV